MDVKGRRMVIWKLEEDNGVVYKIKIKKKLYVPKLDYYLLSPQHIAQELETEP